MRRLASAACVIVALAASRVAFAGPEDAARADALFKEASSLVAKGRYAEACPKLEESQSIDPAVGTQFNLADCWSHVGRTASAYALFLEVARVAKLAGKGERERAARERADQLAPKLGKVVVVVDGEVPGLEVELAKKPFAKDDWGKPIPEDAGSYRVTASAPDHAPFETTIAIVDGQVQTVKIPALVSTLRAPVEPAPAPAPPPPPPRTMKTLAIVAAGVGVAGVAVGSIAGILALGKRSDANRDCPKDTYAGNCPTQAGADAWNAAHSAGNVSTIGFVVGGVGLAGAALLWIAAPKAQVAAGVGPSSLVVRGAF